MAHGTRALPGATQYIAGTGSGQSLSFNPQNPVAPSASVSLQKLSTPTLGADPGGYAAANQNAIADIGKLGNALFTAIRKQKEQDEDVEIIGRIADIQRRNIAHQSEYSSLHQGQSALGAGSEYAAFSDQLFDSLAGEDKWKGNARVQAMLARKKAEYGASAFGAGSSYADKQRQVWHEDQRKSAEDAFFTAVAAGNEAMIQQARDNAIAMWRITNPGRDSVAYENDLARRGAIGSLSMAYAMGDGARMRDMVGRFSGVLGPENTARFTMQADDLSVKNVQGRLAVGDYEGAMRLYNEARGMGSHVAGSRSLTGVAVLTKKHESASEGGVAHVSQGLQATDGNDFGSYSFITKGGAKSSGAEFLRWCAGQGEVGKRLHDRFTAVLGGNWNGIDDAGLWKKGGALRKAWQDTARENPKELEELEDRFVMKRMDGVISRLNPDVQKAIRSNPALMEMAISTINQHRQAVQILNSNYDPNPEVYIDKVYKDRANPKRFAKTGDPSIGERRMKVEREDCLGILRRTGGVQNRQALEALETTMNNEVPGRAIVQKIAGLPSIEDREAAAMDELAKLPEWQRKAAANIVSQELSFQKSQRASKEAKDASDFYAAALEQKWSPVQIGQQIDAMAASGKYRHEFITKLRTLEKDRNKEETAQQKTNALGLMATIDRQMAESGDMISYDSTAIDKAFSDGLITFKQRNEIVEYARSGGARKNVTVENVQGIYRKLIGDTKAVLPPELFSQVYDKTKGLQTTGKPLDNEAISRIVSELLMPVQYERSWWFNGEEPAYKANVNERKVVGMTVPAYRLPGVKAMMRQQGYSDAQISDEKTVAQFYAATQGRK